MSHGGLTTAIQLFNISKQQLLGEPQEDIPSDTLLPYKEDASQPARIVDQVSLALPDPIECLGRALTATQLAALLAVSRIIIYKLAKKNRRGSYAGSD